MRDLRSTARFAAASLVLLMFLSAPLHAQAQKKAAKLPPDLADTKYGPHERNVLDLWKAKSDKPTPLVVFIHGGGFRAGSKEALSPALLDGLLAGGISVMAINYRLSPEVSFPAHYMDCARAIQFARLKAREWNLDPIRIGSTGGSAGAGTSLWIGFHDDMADPKSSDPVLQQSTRLTCMAVQGAQSSYDPRVIKEWVSEAASKHPALEGFFGVKADERDTPKAHKLYEGASAINYLTKDDPPVYAYYSEARKLSPDAKPGQGIHHINFGLRLKEQMDKLGVECTVRHRDEGADADKEIIAFFLKHLFKPPGAAGARRPITLDDVEKGLPQITPDEPIAAEFSAVKAAEYLDRSALNWQKTKNCATCHTNLFYLAARPALSTILPDSGEVRTFYEDYPKVRWENKKPSQNEGFWTIVVGTGLTFNDVQTTGKLSPTARKVLDLMWTVQREDGGWKWPDCNYAPMEIDDHYGVTIAALTVGIAPDGYAETPLARAGLEKLRTYLKNNPPKSLHHRAMLTWCSIRVDGIATEAQRKQTLAELLALQLEDGGWSTAGFLTDWKGLAREDGKPLDTKTSDGYGTGLVIVIARELGVPADDRRLKRGINWLLTHQRVSGKWFTRSPVVEARNLISNVGSAYDILALQACGKLPGWPLGEAKPARR